MTKENLNSIEKLIYLFSKLPGLGTRSARRIVLYLLKDRYVRMDLLSDSLKEVSANIKDCKICYNLDDQEICEICRNDERDNNLIAIVETVADLWAIERSGIFFGKYHVLGGGLSANSNNKPENLRLDSLKSRIIEFDIKEVIIATNATLDGQTTAFYITEFLSDLDIKISRLASGIPMGGELDYLDEGTLSAALSQRQPF